MKQETYKELHSRQVSEIVSDFIFLDEEVVIYITGNQLKSSTENKEQVLYQRCVMSRLS